jgi:glycosyltransferase involved in cell wall biosynthesis
MRVLLLNNIPAPYFDPLFARLGARAGWELTVCYTSTHNAQAGWVERPIEAAPHQTMILDRARPQLARWLGGPASAALALLAELRRARPDYIISYGYTLLPQCAAILSAAAMGIPFAVIGDANVHVDSARGWRRTLKRRWLGWVIGRAAALVTIGTANRQFWESYGARREQLFEARYAVDNDHFARATAAAAGEAEQMRTRLGLDHKVIFLFVGRLIARKNVDLLIRAVRELRDEPIALVIAGDGEERAALEALAAGDQRIVFAGAVGHAELPRYYALADALALPARGEPWGLVINEAMASGLAVIAHRNCGAAVDLVGADNGVALESFSVEEVKAALKQVAGDGTRRRAMQSRSRERINEWTIDGAARGIARAVEASSASRARASRRARAVGEIE